MSGKTIDLSHPHFVNKPKQNNTISNIIQVVLRYFIGTRSHSPPIPLLYLPYCNRKNIIKL